MIALTRTRTAQEFKSMVLQELFNGRLLRYVELIVKPFPVKSTVMLNDRPLVHLMSHHIVNDRITETPVWHVGSRIARIKSLN